MNNINFTQNEMVNMIFILGECQRNVALAVRVYHERYPNLRQPQSSTLKKLLDRFILTGSVAYPKKVFRPAHTIITNDEAQFNVIATVIENQQVSQRQIACSLEISQSSVQRVLKKHRFHGYHMTLNQELHGRDFENRTSFCNFIREQLQQDVNYASRILFSDEATFKNNGMVNKHNAHFYATENPHWVRHVDNQRLWSVNVWGGVVGDYVIGPHFFDNHLNGHNYLQFLQNELPLLLEDVNLALRNNIIFQHDGAPAHTARIVTDYLNQNLNIWIGRNGVIEWPARSPDLTAMDFFMWGYIKEIVYKDVPTTPEDMKDRIEGRF
jgi:predicted transcriptional regulator